MPAVRVREPAHHHAGHHVDQRQRPEQLPAKRRAHADSGERVGQVGEDVLDHRPQRQLGGEEVEDRRVDDRHQHAGRHHERRVRREPEVGGNEDRDRQDNQHERLPPRARHELERQPDRRPPRLLRSVPARRARHPVAERPRAARDLLYARGERHQHAAPRDEREHVDLLHGDALVEGEDPDGPERDRERRDELEAQVREEVAMAELAVQPSCREHQHSGIVAH